MRRLFLLFIFLLPVTWVNAQNNSTNTETETTFILVRHAQKVDDGTSDPELSEEGKKNAENLSEWLHVNFNISAVYSTPYKRTKFTAAPAAKAKGLDVQEYDFKDPAGFLKSLTESNKGKILLIVGHSNTTPMFVNILLGRKEFENLSEDTYNQLFIVKASELGKASAQVIEF